MDRAELIAELLCCGRSMPKVLAGLAAYGRRRLLQALCRMKIVLLLIALSIAFSAAPRVVAAAASDKPLSCNIGPVTKLYGGGQWLVYGCSDGKSVALVTAQGNPGFPFVFSFLYTSKGMTLYGEGNGDKKATDAAFKELQQLSQTDVAALFQQAKAHATAATGAHAT